MESVDVSAALPGAAAAQYAEAATSWTLPADLARYVVEKGSIAVDGVSLTVAGVTHFRRSADSDDLVTHHSRVRS